MRFAIIEAGGEIGPWRLADDDRLTSSATVAYFVAVFPLPEPTAAVVTIALSE